MVFSLASFSSFLSPSPFFPFSASLLFFPPFLLFSHSYSYYPSTLLLIPLFFPRILLPCCLGFPYFIALLPLPLFPLHHSSPSRLYHFPCPSCFLPPSH